MQELRRVQAGRDKARSSRHGQRPWNNILNQRREGRLCVCYTMDGVLIVLQPRKGCFEVRIDGDIIVSLLDLPRPFTKLRALDLEQVAKDIQAKVSK